MEGGFLGEPDARMWLDMHCPRWRCDKDGKCASGPAMGGDWYVYCAGDGEIELGHGTPRKRERIMASGFLGEPDARIWVEQNCPSWRCNADCQCLFGPSGPIDDAIDDLASSGTPGDCSSLKARFSSTAVELDGLAGSFDNNSAYFDQQLRSFDPSDNASRTAVCNDANVAYSLGNAQTAAETYDASYGSLTGLFGDAAASCIGDADYAWMQAEYMRLADQLTRVKDTYYRMLGDFGIFQCDADASQTDADGRADNSRDPDDVDASVEVCEDGLDNDKDGLIDECDAGCCERTVQVTVSDCGPAADDIFLVAIDYDDVGVTPKGESNTFDRDLLPGRHTVTITCLDDGTDPPGGDVGTACIWVIIYGGEAIGGDEVWIDYGRSEEVDFVVPTQASAPPFPRVIDGSSLRHLEDPDK